MVYPFLIFFFCFYRIHTGVQTFAVKKKKKWNGPMRNLRKDGRIEPRLCNDVENGIEHLSMDVAIEVRISDNTQND